MSRHQIPQSRQQQLSRALAQMTEALRILDGVDAPGEIGSQLDLAIARLQKQLGLEDQLPASVEALIARLAVEPSTSPTKRSEESSLWDFPSV